MSFAEPQPQPGKRIAMVLALTVHLLLAAFLFYGIRWQTKMPQAIEVELVRASPQPIAPAPPEPVQEVKPEPRPEPKTEPRAEIKPPPLPPKPEIAIKAKPVAPPKPVKTPAPKPQYDPFQKQLEEEIKQTDVRKKLADDEKLLKKLDKEKADLAAAAQLSKAQRAWQDNIAAKIKGNIVRPANATGNPEAIFEVSLLPDGSLVGEPKLRKSTGTAALDAAIERAIKKSDPLPKPADPSVFQRVLTLKFRPLEDQ